MTNIPKRTWFRFHLLTLVLMMLVGGAWLGLNMRPPFIETIRRENDKKDFDRFTVIVRGRGWPVAQNRVEFQDRSRPEQLLAQYENGNATIYDQNVIEVKEWRIFAYPEYDAIYDNIFLCAVALAVVTVVSEWLLRRREGAPKSQ